MVKRATNISSPVLPRATNVSRNPTESEDSVRILTFLSLSFSHFFLVYHVFYKSLDNTVSSSWEKF